jgi:O-antigen ligase
MISKYASIFFLYVVISTGTLTAYDYTKELFILYLLPNLLLIFLFSSLQGGYFNVARVLNVLKYYFPLMMYYGLSSISTENIEMLYRKLEGSFLITLIMGLVISKNLEKMGEVKFFKIYIYVVMAILLITVFYKVNYGFFDRDTRFFLNGPIVFSWLMCFSAMGIIYYVVEGVLPERYVIFVLFLIGAALWSASKGPILALVIVTIKILMGSNNIRNKIRYILLLFAAGLVMWYLIPESFVERLDGLTRLNSTDTESVDFGSIGIRYLMWESAWNIFLNNFFIGVGPTNWITNSEYGELLYPHNLILEILSEIGILGAILFAISIVWIWRDTSEFGKLTIIFFIICSSFSGDFSYLRMVMGFAIGYAIFNSKIKENKK